MTTADLTDQTIATYDQYADVYDQEVVEFWQLFPRTTVQAFCQDLPGKRVLDLGSGSGRDAIILRDQALEVVCLDASKAMVDLTHRLGFESHHASFATMNLGAQQYDGVWAYTSLIHIPPAATAKAIQKVARALKPGGRFLIGVILGNADGLVERHSMPGAKRYFKHYTQPELTQLVTNLGFTLQFEETYQPHTTRYLSQIYTLNEPTQ